MTRSRVLLAVLVLFLTTGVALASGSSRRPTPSSQLDSFSTVETIEVTIVAVEEGNVLVLQADEGAPQARIEIANGVAIKAKNKKNFGGRKKLDFSDLEAGQRIRVTRQIRDGEITRIRVLS